MTLTWMRLSLVVCTLIVGLHAGLVDAAQCFPKRDAKGHIMRSAKQVRAFVRANPCPSTGLTRGKCPGYIVDHVKALCNCGEDRPSNMQWQTVLEAKKKDRMECHVRPVSPVVATPEPLVR